MYKIKFTTTIFLYLSMIGSLLTSRVAFSQKERNINVLKANKIGKVFYFNLSSKQNALRKVFICYLGNIKVLNHENFKILTWKSVWGANHNTSGIVYIYDRGNKFIGKYNLGSALDLPARIEGNLLVFTNKLKDDCDFKLISKIDFSNGPPKEIFIKCKDVHGDVYSFSKEE